MPAFDRPPRFQKDRDDLDPALQDRFRVAGHEFVEDLDPGGEFRRGLRVKRLQGTEGVLEMTFAPNGRATWGYGPEQRAGLAHVVWRRLGDHSILDEQQ